MVAAYDFKEKGVYQCGLIGNQYGFLTPSLMMLINVLIRI